MKTSVLECLLKPRLFLTVDILPFPKLSELLDINHNSSKRSIIFIPHLFKFSVVECLVIL